MTVGLQPGCVAAPILLFADAGVPMIFLTFPAMVLLLVPIIMVEAFVCKRFLRVSLWESIKANAASNVTSMVIGVPVAWAIMLAVEFFVFGSVVQIPSVSRVVDKWNSPLARVVSTILSSAWLSPDEKNLYWMIPVAAIVLLVPTYLLSVWVESYIVLAMLFVDQEDQSAAETRIQRAVRDANRVSYGLLTAGSIAWLLISLLEGPPR
jgi:hypothetical protein